MRSEALPPPVTACPCSRRKTTEVLRINVGNGTLEQDNDRVCESTYESEVGWLAVAGRRWLWVKACRQAPSPQASSAAEAFCCRQRLWMR